MLFLPFAHSQVRPKRENDFRSRIAIRRPTSLQFFPFRFSYVCRPVLTQCSAESRFLRPAFTAMPSLLFRRDPRPYFTCA
jgi:hypothetical protein